MIVNHHIRDFSNGKPKTLAFILHGYGADGENLVDLADIFSQSVQNCIFVVPNAPFPYEYAPTMGRQWFSLLNRDENILMQGAETARKILLEFIEKLLEKYKLSWSDVIFIGFSQGTMMSLYTALKLEVQCKAVIGFSGTIVSAEDTVATCKTKPPVCLVHGGKDAVVPCALGKFTAKLLKQNGFDVYFHEIEGLEHSINLDSIRIAKEFLEGLGK